MATSGFKRFWVHSHSIIPRALCQRATQNIDMAVEPEEGGKLAHECLQYNLPVRAKTGRQTMTPDKTLGFLCLKNPGRRQTAIPKHAFGMSLKSYVGKYITKLLSLLSSAQAF
jgi:hypothetical protein